MVLLSGGGLHTTIQHGTYLSTTTSMVLTDKKNRLELSPLLQLNNALLGKFKPLKESLICQEPEVMGIDADDDEGKKI